VVVAGHSDNVPIGPSLRARFSSNWELAAARAAEVTEFLQSQGVPPTRLIAVSFGEYRPIASNDTTEGRAENRRIELLLRPFTQQDYFSAP
jgi:chemotaxis protein MotB